MTDYLISSLQEAVRSGAHKPLIVCGAGVSTQATNGKAPRWADLIRSGVQRVADLDANARAWAADSARGLQAGGTQDWIAVADEVTSRLGGAHNREFADWLEDEVGRLAPGRRDLLDAIIALGCPIATTNYDDVLAKAANRPAVSWSDHPGTLRILHDHPGEGILHLHGHWRSPEHVVLGSTSYAAHSADERARLLQRIATLDRPTVFIGCSQDGLSDPDFYRLDSFLSEWQDVAPRRYWLIRQELDEHGVAQPPPSPNTDKRLYPVVFGTEYDALPALLRRLKLPALAPSIDTDTVAVRCIDQFEPKPEIFGRDSEVALVVDALLTGKPAMIAGGPGMGKTAVAITALYDPRVVAQFGRRRVVASLETATEPRAILTRLVETLGLTPSGDEVSLLRILETRAAEAPLAAVLDNAETVFDIDRGETQRLLDLVAQIRGLSLAVTIRGTAPHVAGAVRIDDMAKLVPPADRDAFIAIAGETCAGDPDQPRLLQALDGHALSISLVAAQASGLPTLQGLREALEEAQAEMLRRPGEQESRLTSVRASLALSLGSRRMRDLPLARRLVGLLALLPGGLAEAEVASLLGERGNVTKAKANEAIACLHQLRLVERRLDRRLRMLTPLRECTRLEVAVLPADRKRLLDRYLTIATKAGRIGRPDWPQVREEVEAEADNLDPICCLALDTDASTRRLDQALDGLAEFYGLSSRGSVNGLIQVAATATEKGSQRHAACLFNLGRIATSRSDHAGARTQFEQALALYRRIGDVLGEANCIYKLGQNAHSRSDHATTAAQLEQALVLYCRVGDVLGEAHCIYSLGQIAGSLSDHATAAAQFEQALALYRRVRSVLGEAHCIRNLGEIASSRSDHATAAAHFKQALALYRHIGACRVRRTASRASGRSQARVRITRRRGRSSSRRWRSSARRRRAGRGALHLQARRDRPLACGSRRSRFPVRASTEAIPAVRQPAKRSWGDGPARTGPLCRGRATARHGRYRGRVCTLLPRSRRPGSRASRLARAASCACLRRSGRGCALSRGGAYLLDRDRPPGSRPGLA